MKDLKLAILGYGDAGRAYGSLLNNKEAEIRDKYGVAIKVTAIATGSHGTLIDPDGIDLHNVEEELANRGEKLDQAGLYVAQNANYDALLELTPLNIFTGQPAINHIKAAFGRGKHAITANKGPIAWAFRELREMSVEGGCQFYYETTVMDGTPIFNLVSDTLKMCNVTAIDGILNSTTNYLLEELAKGVPYDEAMEEGRRRGFVETDPSMDVEGWDAAAKLTALMNVLMDAGITPDKIIRKGIDGISADEIAEAAENGKVIKLLCNGKFDGGTATGTVMPALLDRTELLATISGTSSAVSISTDLMGKVTIVEHDPEIEQTAYGVFSDTLRLIEGICQIK